MAPLPRFIAASGFTNLADGIAVVVWAWVATLLTRDPILVALMPVAVRLPWFVFALPADIVTDRVNRRRLIVAMDILRSAAFLLAAAALVTAGPLDPPPGDGIAHPMLFAALLCCALGVGTAEVFRDNAAQTMLPPLVPQDRLETANGRLWSVELVGNALLGPAWAHSSSPPSSGSLSPSTRRPSRWPHFWSRACADRSTPPLRDRVTGGGSWARACASCATRRSCASSPWSREHGTRCIRWSS